MLPLVSSITTTVMGWASFSKERQSAAACSLSRISKSVLCQRSGISRRWASVTVAKSDTSSVPVRRRGLFSVPSASRGDDSREQWREAFASACASLYSNRCSRGFAGIRGTLQADFRSIEISGLDRSYF